MSGTCRWIVALLVGERAVGLDLVAVDPVGAAVGDVQQRLVGREGDAVGELQPGVDDLLFAVGADVPDLARLVRRRGWGWSRRCLPSWRTTRSLPRKPSAIGVDVAVGVVGDDLLGARGDRVEPAVGAERLAVALLRVGEEEARPCRRGRSCRSCCWRTSLKKTSPLALAAGPSVNL